MKKSVETPGVLLTLKKAYNHANMWEIGNWSGPAPPSPIDKGEIVLGLGLEEGSNYQVTILTQGGRIATILKENMVVL